MRAYESVVVGLYNNGLGGRVISRAFLCNVSSRQVIINIMVVLTVGFLTMRRRL